MGHSLTATLLSAAALSLGACNTMQGLGRDLEAGGRAMARTAAQAQTDMQTPEAASTAVTAIPLTSIQARARALSARPGAIESEEVKTDQGSAHYVFHIRGEDGALYAVDVDAQTSAAVETRL